VVAIGASAGGLDALKQFFAVMPTVNGFCFLLIVHHAPEAPSLLTEILDRCTPMEVVTAVAGMPLRQNTVCVIPPAGGLTISSGRFIVDEHAQQRRFPIDHFFRLLAAEAGKRTIAVILSGTGSDGTEGAKEVKDAGGVVLVQEPAPIHPPLAEPGKGIDAPGDETSRGLLISQLEEQLRVTHEQLQATCEQLETSNEGFMMVNEELMSINEELQSANEELVTSKAELQALNEELLTVNAELSEKVDELNQATSDLENLLSSSEIATIFLDLNLNVKRFTPAIAGLFNMISADISHPLLRLAGKIDLPNFSDDAAAVLAGRTVVDREVTTRDGSKCYLKRVLPYRNAVGIISGIVITFVDITERKRAEEVILRHSRELHASNEELTRLNCIMEGRELRMIELKKEVNELRGRTDQAPLYPLDFENDLIEEKEIQ
jgi:PAS domain-containing protein